MRYQFLTYIENLDTTRLPVSIIRCSIASKCPGTRSPWGSGFTKQRKIFLRRLPSQSACLLRYFSQVLCMSVGQRSTGQERRYGPFQYTVLQVCTTPSPPPEDAFAKYALTWDNVLKMMWIALRVRSRVPVILMGESGVGKTALIKYLAHLLGVGFSCLNIHAGTSEDQIAHAVSAPPNTAHNDTWVFLDEINTCQHLGLLNDILCHRSLYGTPLASHIYPLAACNPYRLNPWSERSAAAQVALASSKHVRPRHSLTYAVHPLPESMLDYVWDYGGLLPDEERCYIKSIVHDAFTSVPPDWHLLRWVDVVTDLLLDSQQFFRRSCPEYVVSLRDVKRYTDLLLWFVTMEPWIADKRRDRLEWTMKQLQCLLNAALVCYWCRIPTRELRDKYQRKVEAGLKLPKGTMWKRMIGEMHAYAKVIHLWFAPSSDPPSHVQLSRDVTRTVGA